MASHQYVERDTGRIITEKLLGDRTVRMLYHHLRENFPAMFRLLISPRMSELLGFVHYDLDRYFGGGPQRLFARVGADMRECVDEPGSFDSMRKVFERRIRYWEIRPMDTAASTIVSPADSRLIVGSLTSRSPLFIKEKFFDHREMLGHKLWWTDRYQQGDFAIFRLTPEKYHYNHSPVTGRVVDIFVVEGQYHSCNPAAVTAVSSIYSKNTRYVTMIDTDVEQGSGVGMVAMVEIVALMIGGIKQCYSRTRYDAPMPLVVGERIEKGCPKSLFQPGSSTVVLLFEPGRVSFSLDLVENSIRHDVNSRFSSVNQRRLVETDLRVRSTIGHRQL